MNSIFSDIKKKFGIKKINKEAESENNICPEKWSICQRSKCKDESCKYYCNNKLGHESIHTCNHRHQCMEICSLIEYSYNCNRRCKLEYGHDGMHICEAEHYCNGKCYFFGRSRNFGEKCALLYPHESLHHICRNIHICDKECYLYGKSKVCKRICNLEYGHSGPCNCGENHDQNWTNII